MQNRPTAERHIEATNLAVEEILLPSAPADAAAETVPDLVRGVIVEKLADLSHSDERPAMGDEQWAVWDSES